MYLLFIIGIVFSSLGALMAYFITYEEWVHHYPSPKIPRRMALEAALFTFTFFLAVVSLAGMFLG